MSAAKSDILDLSSEREMSRDGSTTPLEVVVQNAMGGENLDSIPSDDMLTNCARHSFAAYQDSQVIEHAENSCKELTIRIVGLAEMQNLNRTYRNKDKPTNVLSFQIENQFEPLLEQGDNQFGDMDFEVLGDVVICHPVIVDEAKAQGKTVNRHYLHMVVHGVLHLCGLDHQDDEEASIMEAMEIEVLAKLGVTNPYETSA